MECELGFSKGQVLIEAIFWIACIAVASFSIAYGFRAEYRHYRGALGSHLRSSQASP